MLRIKQWEDGGPDFQLVQISSALSTTVVFIASENLAQQV